MKQPAHEQLEPNATATPAKTFPRLMATFRPQVWINDYAVDMEGKHPFDATSEFLSLNLERIHSFQENDHNSDALADNLDARWHHGGPFEVDVDVDGWLEDHGFPDGRTSLTQADLVTLRKRFAALLEVKRRLGDCHGRLLSGELIKIRDLPDWEVPAACLARWSNKDGWSLPNRQVIVHKDCKWWLCRHRDHR